MPNQHLTFVLAPVFATITRAKKTRELWAASFVFSRWMYHLLAAAEDKGREQALPDLTTLAPAFSADEPHAYGAGMYHDRGFLTLSAEPTKDQMDAWQATALENLATELGTTPAKLRPLLQLQASLREDSGGASPPILALNKLLDNLEQRPVYDPEEGDDNLVQLLDKGIHKLYEKGYEKGGERIFIDFVIPARAGKPLREHYRLPSIPEIALRELAEHKEKKVRNIYRDVVKLPMDDIVGWLIDYGGDGRRKDMLYLLEDAIKDEALRKDVSKSFDDSQRLNDHLYQNLRKELPSPDILRFRHKYYAVVQLDGDGLGKHLRAIEDEKKDFKAFSNKLLAYAKMAAEKVINYGGTPIFSGGDDLLFLAPIAMPNRRKTDDEGNPLPEAPTDVMSLCKELDQLFKDTVDQNLGLSGGIFVSYYKYPLGEAVKEAGRLERDMAKKFSIWTKTKRNHPDKSKRLPCRKKNAIALSVRKHSGQTFEATFWLGGKHKCTDSFEKLTELLRFDAELDDSFLAAALHRLQSAPALLADVAQNGNDERVKAYREHQFGKKVPRHEGKFVKDTLQLARKLFADYGNALSEDEAKAIVRELEKLGRTTDNPFAEAMANRLFVALRFKQFLLQPDHD